jgi:hypothetical protein
MKDPGLAHMLKESSSAKIWTQWYDSSFHIATIFFASHWSLNGGEASRMAPERVQAMLVFFTVLSFSPHKVIVCYMW